MKHAKRNMEDGIFHFHFPDTVGEEQLLMQILENLVVISETGDGVGKQERRTSRPLVLFVFKCLGSSSSSLCIPGLSPGCSLTCLVLPASPYCQLSFCLPVGVWANYHHSWHSKVKSESQVAYREVLWFVSCTVFLPGKHELAPAMPWAPLHTPLRIKSYFRAVMNSSTAHLYSRWVEGQRFGPLNLYCSFLVMCQKERFLLAPDVLCFRIAILGI